MLNKNNKKNTILKMQKRELLELALNKIKLMFKTAAKTYKYYKRLIVFDREYYAVPRSYKLTISTSL